MGMGLKCGQMAQDMKVAGKTIRPMVKVSLFMLMEMCMKDCG